MTAPDRVPTGAAPIDRLLEGGLEPDGLTEVFGEGGTGKTVLCLEAALQVARADRWVFYIDTEGVSTDRVARMAGPDAERILRRLLLSTPPDLARQDDAVRTATALVREGRRPIGLIVLDSAVLHYRLTLGTADEDDARRRLLAELADLLGCAISSHVPVLFTNQVWRNISTGSLEPIGGPFVNHLSKTVLRLDRPEAGPRRAVLVKHRSLPPRETTYRITERGLE